MDLPLGILSVAYPENTSSPSHPSIAPDRKSLILSEEASITCRRINDLASISATLQSGDGARLMLQWPDLEDYVRIYLSLERILVGDKDPTLSSTARIRVALSPTEKDLTCDWLALLKRERDGPFLFHRHIDRNLKFTSPEAERVWDFKLDDIDPSQENRYFLALQFPASQAHFHLRHFGLRIISLEGAGGAFRSSIPGFLEGWSAADEANVELVDGSGERVWTKPVGCGRFTLATGLDTHCDTEPAVAHLTAGGLHLAYLDLGADKKVKHDEAARQPHTLSVEQIEQLYNDQRIDLLWMLSKSDPKRICKTPPSTEQDYALNLFLSRALLNLAASESAYKGLKAALADTSRFATLSAGTQRRMQLSFARACMRSGRRPEAESVLQSMQTADQLDWEVYFHLATLMDTSQSKRRSTYFHIMHSLNSKLPISALTARLEDDLTRQEFDDAWFLALKEIKQRGESGAELWLSLANVHLARGDSTNWAASIGKYFTIQNLSPPPLDLSTPAGESVFDRMSGASPAEGAQDGQPLVTVIMTAFNAERTIKTAVQSVLAQSHRNLRLVAIDDRSTDTTFAILSEIKAQDPRLTIIKTTFNIGTFAAKNIALSKFKSDYFTFHDADDWMHPERIATHLDVMRSDPRLRCTLSQWFRMDDRGMVNVQPLGGYAQENPSSTFIHSSVISRTGYFDSVRAWADTEFLWRIRRRFGDESIKLINRPLSIGRYHDSSLTRSGITAFDDFRFSALRLDYLESYVEWHRICVVDAGGGQALYLPFPHYPRRFDAPPAVLSEHAERLISEQIEIEHE